MKFLLLSSLLSIIVPTSNAFALSSTKSQRVTQYDSYRILKTSTTTLYSTVNAKVPSSNTVLDKPSLGVKVGDTKGAALLLEDIAISRGPNQILSDVNLRIERGQRWGIVGPNGVGKSTLLNAIIGYIPIDEGRALSAPKLHVGYLRQTAVAGSKKTVFEEASSEMFAIQTARERMEIAEAKIAQGDTSSDTLTEFDEAQTDFTNAGGWTQEQEVDLVLKGLGFQPADSQRFCSEFSGGWQMRIALARLLLSQPDILLLDEPSNHLDSSARDWLGKYLAAFQGTMVLVSHDVPLLQASVNNIAEVTGGTLLTYISCAYNKYLEEKDFRQKSAVAEYERNLAEAARLQSFVDRWGASATKAASAQSRVKMIEKMEKEGKLKPPPVAVMEKRWTPVLKLPDAPKAIGEDLLTLISADIGYTDKDEPLLKNIDLVLRKGMKLILRGPNGAGKSTLMTALRGDLPLLKGSRDENEKLRLGVFTQDLAQHLDVNSRAIDLVTAYAREGKYGDITISDQDARTVMGGLGLSQDKPLRKVGELSGGEKARVALSMFALKASNVLMLDEPSNHLDIECIEALSSALRSWGGKDGAIVVVSHDRSFCNDVGFTHVGTVQDGSLVIEERDLIDQDWDLYDLESTTTTSVDDTSAVTSTSTSSVTKKIENKILTEEEKEEQKLKRKKAFNAPKRIAQLEKQIEKSESKVAEIDEKMMKVGSDVGKLVDLNKEKEKEEEKIASMMQEWEELEQLLAELQQ